MFTRNTLENILFLDIETASVAEQYQDLPERMRDLWDRKARLLINKDESLKTPEAAWTQKAAIFSEFGKVVCITCGYIRFENDTPLLRLKSFFGPDEHALLTGFAGMLNQFMSRNRDRLLCAHNGKEFDFPYLGRRFVINRLPVPEALQTQGKKPWEVNFLDTMDMWKFGDFKSFTSLDLLTAVLDIPSPKDDMDGSDVGRVFWKDHDHDRIRRYCERDVIATAQVMLRFSGLPLIEEAEIERV